MKKIVVGSKVVEIYDSIEDLPIIRFHKFNKFMLIDAGVGSDLEEINSKITQILLFIDRKEPDKAKVELENLRQGLYLVSQEISPKHLAFMVLIKSVNGKEITDISDEGLKRLQSELKVIRVRWLDRLLEAVKKKINQELGLYFPEQFDTSQFKNYYDRLRQRVLYQLDYIITGTSHDKEVDGIDEYLLTFIKPKLFSGKNSVEIRYDKQFDEMCVYLSHELGVKPKELTVMEFYNAIEYLKKVKKNGKSN